MILGIELNNGMDLDLFEDNKMDLVDTVFNASLNIFSNK